MTTPTVKFGGVILGGGVNYGWEFTSGVNPSNLLYTVTEARADRLKDSLGHPHTLEISSPGKLTSTWEQIYLLEIRAGGDPFIKRFGCPTGAGCGPKSGSPAQ